MDRVRVFLRTTLFTARTDPHVPPGTSIVSGRVRESTAGGLVIEVHTWQNDEGATLPGAPRTLFLPAAKIDHVLLLESGAETG